MSGSSWLLCHPEIHLNPWVDAQFPHFRCNNPGGRASELAASRVICYSASFSSYCACIVFFAGGGQFQVAELCLVESGVFLMVTGF